MILESIMTPERAIKYPWFMIIIGFIYNSLAILLSLWIFRDYASLVMVFLTAFACAPLIYRTIKREGKKDCEIMNETKLLFEHSKALNCFIMLFIGITLSCMIWYMFIPPDYTIDVFSVQTNTITQINSRVTGVTGEFSGSAGLFSKIFLNNIKVLIFCVLFALLFGLGAIFILAWNASVIGVAMGNFARTNLSNYTTEIGLNEFGKYLHVGSWGFLRYAFHGIPEILAYFIGGLAGGIIYFAIIRHDFELKKIENILLDSSDLLILAIIVLVVAGLMEVFLTPRLF
jgi:uncharacterized membrane protein SpoIIM required for sporulation